MATSEQIENIARQLTAIVSIIMYVCGSTGNILNIFIFTKWSYFGNALDRHRNNRQTSNSSLYLLVSSVTNLIPIIYPLLIHIMVDAYQYQITESNVFIFCKLQYYILHTFDLTSLTCLCMPTFDRYLVSSRDVRLRQMSSTRQRTKLIILFLICLNVLHSISIAIYYDISDTGECDISSITYLYYYLFTFHILLHGLIPVIFLTVFGILIFKQLKLIGQVVHIGHLNTEKQLSCMLLLMSVGIILSSTTNCIERIHDVLLFYNDQPEPSYLFLFHIIASLLFYTNPVCCFYIFYVSTPNFRKQVHKLIQCKKQNHRTARNQVNIIPTTNNLELPVGVRGITTIDL